MSTNDYSNISNSLMEAMSGGKGIIVLNTGKTDDQKGAPAAPVSNQIPTGLPWYGRLVASITSTNANP